MSAVFERKAEDGDLEQLFFGDEAHRAGKIRQQGQDVEHALMVGDQDEGAEVVDVFQPLEFDLDARGADYYPSPHASEPADALRPSKRCRQGRQARKDRRVEYGKAGGRDCPAKSQRRFTAGAGRRRRVRCLKVLIHRRTVSRSVGKAYSWQTEREQAVHVDTCECGWYTKSRVDECRLCRGFVRRS
jgi:hypothetical protein